MTNYHHHQHTGQSRIDRVPRWRRFPFRPLEDWLNARFRNPTSRADTQCGGELTAATIGAIIGANRQTVYHWRDNGITWWRADEAAIRAGAHPLEIWADFHTHTQTRPAGAGEVAA